MDDDYSLDGHNRMEAYTQTMRVLATLALMPVWLLAQGIRDAKPKAADYPLHATVGDVSIGAEYLVHSIPVGGQTYFAPDYLIVEVAVYPKANDPIVIADETFTLRVNSKKQVIYPQSPGFVAASIKYPDWEPRVSKEVAVGPVIIGRPTPVGRFPDDKRGNPLPPPPKAPQPDDQRNIEEQAPADPAEALARVGLPQGEVSKPVTGFLYFHYKARPKSIHSVELVCQTKAGSSTLQLK